MTIRLQAAGHPETAVTHLFKHVTRMTQWQSFANLVRL